MANLSTKNYLYWTTCVRVIRKCNKGPVFLDSVYWSIE